MTAKRIDTKKAAKGFYREGKTFKKALIDAGMSEKQAGKGKAVLLERNGLRKAFASEHKRQLKKLELMGAALTAEEQENLVRGSLLDSVLTEKGAPRVRASELLGRDRRVNLFQPDQAIGIFNNMAIPSGWESRYLTTEPSAATEPKVLPAKFVHAALESGKVEIPDKLHVENEPVPVTVPSPTTSNFSEDDFETLK